MQNVMRNGNLAIKISMANFPSLVDSSKQLVLNFATYLNSAIT